MQACWHACSSIRVGLSTEQQCQRGSAQQRRLSGSLRSSGQTGWSGDSTPLPTPYSGPGQAACCQQLCPEPVACSTSVAALEAFGRATCCNRQRHCSGQLAARAAAACIGSCQGSSRPSAGCAALAHRLGQRGCQPQRHASCWTQPPCLLLPGHRGTLSIDSLCAHPAHQLAPGSCRCPGLQVKSTKMNRTIVVRRDYLHYIKKYQRWVPGRAGTPAGTRRFPARRRCWCASPLL